MGMGAGVGWGWGGGGQVGTVTLSFFTSGANYEGIAWSNGVVAACRPGFVLTPSSSPSSPLAIPFDPGYVTLTIRPDTEPTADTTVYLTTSQVTTSPPHDLPGHHRVYPTSPPPHHLPGGHHRIPHHHPGPRSWPPKVGLSTPR